MRDALIALSLLLNVFAISWVLTVKRGPRGPVGMPGRDGKDAK